MTIKLESKSIYCIAKGEVNVSRVRSLEWEQNIRMGQVYAGAYLTGDYTESEQLWLVLFARPAMDTRCPSS
jgi:hypothetical protein